MHRHIEAIKHFPVIVTGELARSREFYKSLLGCEAVFESDWYIHLVSPRGLEIGLMITGHPSQPEFLHATYGGHGIILSFEVSDVDAEHKKALEAGMPLAHEIRTEPWGQRHFMLRDPSGVVVDIVQQLGQ
jgi:catechol 2,3-dioxygenase-like lactoylglutathione lyase family enzyme